MELVRFDLLLVGEDDLNDNVLAVRVGTQSFIKNMSLRSASGRRGNLML
ncbi:MAG: hypothetical protein JWR38_2570 [Mucilaginibacter sp.]|nr:hypothetical protein [Mucilaginibacter sp.]